MKGLKFQTNYFFDAKELIFFNSDIPFQKNSAKMLLSQKEGSRFNGKETSQKEPLLFSRAM